MAAFRSQLLNRKGVRLQSTEKKTLSENKSMINFGNITEILENVHVKLNMIFVDFDIFLIHVGC